MRVDSGEHKLCEEEKMCIKCVSFMYRNIYMVCVWMAICMIIHTQNDTYVVYIHPNMYVMFFCCMFCIHTSKGDSTVHNNKVKYATDPYLFTFGSAFLYIHFFDMYII